MLVFAVGLVAVGHEPARELGGDAPAQQRLGAMPDEEQCRGSAGHDPQPEELRTLGVRGLVRMQPLGLQDLLLNLLWDRFAGMGRFVACWQDRTIGER